VDFKKAYDSIRRQSLLNILMWFNFPIKLINLTEVTLKNTEIKLKVASKASSPVKVTTGLGQRDAVSPILLNLVLENIIREINITVMAK